MQFTDMKGLITVDQAMVERTIKWLNGRRKANGGFERNTRALDSFGGAPEEHTDAYITWALTEAGLDTKKDVDYVVANCAEKKNDAYIWALVSICLYRLNRKKEAQKWSRKLAELQRPDGSVMDEQTSITRSGGSSLFVETTALSILAWLNDEEEFSLISEKAIQFLTSSCKGGRFGSTQATLLALKAIVAYDKLRASPPEEGVFVVSLNGNEESRVTVHKKPEALLSASQFGHKFKKGENTLTLEMLKGRPFPYSVTLDFFAIKGDSSDECKVRIETNLNDTVLKEGKGTEVKVTLRNITDESLPMTSKFIT